MNCEDARHDILLEDAGELSARKTDCLRQHLVSCPVCAAFAQELSQMRTALRNRPAPGPSPLLIHRILENAREAVPARPAPPTFWRAWAAAAVFVIAMAGGWWAWRASQTASREAEPPGGVAELGGFLLATLPEADAADWRVESEEDALDYVARGILLWQGLGVEDDWGASEGFTESEELIPTTLQWRSTPEPGAERRV